MKKIQNEQNRWFKIERSDYRFQFHLAIKFALFTTGSIIKIKNEYELWWKMIWRIKYKKQKQSRITVTAFATLLIYLFIFNSNLSW